MEANGCVNVAYSYLSIALATIGYSLIMRSRKEKLLECRRKVDTSEIKTLLAEFESFSPLQDVDKEKNKIAEAECSNIKSRIKEEEKKDIFELDVLGLRKALASLPPGSSTLIDGGLKKFE